MLFASPRLGNPSGADYTEEILNALRHRGLYDPDSFVTMDQQIEQLLNDGLQGQVGGIVKKVLD